ncbi:MAG: enoyl-CoA hydratase-related protein [Pseudomonadales bacterium]
MTDDTNVLIEDDDGFVRTLRLNRPKRKNALTDALGWAIVEAVERAAHDDSVRVVAITGNGDAFCSGADLGRAAETLQPPGGLSAQDQHLDDLGWIGRFLLTIRLDCDKPVVAGINGVAVGAGLALAMCADMRIMSDAANLHPGYIRAGTSPDGGLSWTLPTLIGHEQAMRFLLDPRMVPATEALQLGLVGEVVAAEQLGHRLQEYCAHLAGLAPIGVRQTKRLAVRAAIGADLEAHLRDELSYVRRGLSSDDGREAVKAIFEKRQPTFTGR